jgi:hypothetical protein
MPQNKLSLKYPICPRCKSHRMVPWTPNHKGGKPRWACVLQTSKRNGNQGREFCLITTDPTRPPRDRSGAPEKAMVFRRPLGKMKRLIITAAQNATPIHVEFWESLQQAAKYLDAEIIVIPLRYRNPTSKWTAKDEDDQWWATAVMPFLYNARRRLNENLMLLADIKTVPTASSPLTGFDAVSGAESAIIGHTKLQMKTIATPANKLPKIMTTTGACTIVNYTDSKVGKIGEFHHSLGAVVVELEEKVFHLRHLTASRDGSFTDLDSHFTPAGRTAALPPLALIMGDTHVDSIDPRVERATFGKGGIVESLQPETLVWHDLLDGYAVNHHTRLDPFVQVAKQVSGRDDARAEVERAIDFLVRHTKGRKSVVVSSNHDDFLRRWVVDTDWRRDPTNAEFYLKTALAMVKGTTMSGEGTSYPSPFKYWIDQRGASDITVLNGDESYSLSGIELGMHGDRGPNGVRGSRMNLRRIGSKSVIGHSHSPGIEEGCYQVGTSTLLRLEYNTGPSSWLNTHCLLHANGKRQLISIIDGQWRMK